MLFYNLNVPLLFVDKSYTPSAKFHGSESCHMIFYVPLVLFYEKFKSPLQATEDISTNKNPQVKNEKQINMFN